VLDAGLAVPGDVSVIGFDGAAVAPFMTPSLSTVQQDTAELGRRAANLICDIVLGEPTSNVRRVVVPCTVMLRDSVRAGSS
jgi:LacI family repressor for deo operon, udp, cdd, tsx, nupC, and nupG